MATASPFDAAQQKVLDSLRAATRKLLNAGSPAEVAQKAAEAVLKLTGSAGSVVALGSPDTGYERLFPRTSARGKPLDDRAGLELLAAAGFGTGGSAPGRRGRGAAAGAELRAHGEPIGAIAVTRQAGYSEAERIALDVFANYVGLAIGASGLVRVERAHEQEDLRRTVDRLTKVDSARQVLLRNMTNVVENERKRVVSELHDDALQKLTAAELLLARLAPGAAPDAAGLEKLRRLLEQTESALRRLVFDVRPPALENPDGLAQSIRDRVAMLAGSGINAEVELDLPDDLSLDLRTLVFREVAEAVGNVERHSRAANVRIALSVVDRGVHGVIRDDGQGFVVAERSNLPGHLGLLGLRERALMAGGRYKIESAPGAGTLIEFWVPIDR